MMWMITGRFVGIGVDLFGLLLTPPRGALWRS